VVAVAEPDGEVRSVGIIPNRLESVRKMIAKLGPVNQLKACYEAGPTGYPASDLSAKLLLIFGEENRPPFWGHTFYIGLTDHLISPFLTGYEGTALDSLYPSNSDLFEKARAQGAATGYVHAFGMDGDPLQGGLGGGKAFPVDLALGLIDALEWTAAGRGSLIPLFHAWNNDFRVAPVGGEDSLANMQDYRPVGIIRTYVWMGPEFSVRSWVGAIKQGHTVMSSGPLLEFKVKWQIARRSHNVRRRGPPRASGGRLSLIDHPIAQGDFVPEWREAQRVLTGSGSLCHAVFGED
jgi:hypothetical protein